MAMRTASPWWLTLVLAGGLLFFFLGERPFDHVDVVGNALTGLGLIAVLGSTALRLFGMTRADGQKRAVEKVLVLCHVGVVLALVLYAASTGWGRELLGKAPPPDDGLDKYGTSLRVLWGILILISFVPLAMAEIALGAADRDSLKLGGDKGSAADEASIDRQRVTSMATSGLTIALALSFLMVTCNVAKERNIHRNLSYFRTSSPGTATVAMVESVSDPIVALLFFESVNEVKTEVRTYFETLADRAGNLEIQEHDRVLSGDLAERLKVTKDGTIVLIRKSELDDPEVKTPKTETFTVDTDWKKARTSQLKTLDSTVQKSLMKVIRDKRIAYLTVGHGEVNDPASAGMVRAGDTGAKTQTIKTILGMLNYQAKDLGRGDLAVDVPTDADVVMILGPLTELLDEELEALDRYLANGGSLLIALDPQRGGNLGLLEGRLGVRWDPRPLIDDSRPMVDRRNAADALILAATQFSSHASVTTLSKQGAKEGLPVFLGGSFDDAEFTRKVDGSEAKRTYVIESAKEVFRSLDRNLRFDEAAGEKRDTYHLAAAIEDAKALPAEASKDEDKSPENGMRALVFGDVELFVDTIQLRVPLTQFVFADAIKWLGGEEALAGETESEKDVPIEHTRSRDAKWFYGSIVGAPLLIICIGMLVTSIRGGRRKRRKS
jgi:hypothetical protein